MCRIPFFVKFVLIELSRIEMELLTKGVDIQIEVLIELSRIEIV